MDAQAFATHAYWAQEYVGLGPYRVERWEPGTAIEGVAFDGHALGRPRIDRTRVVFMADTNTVLANLLTGDVHYSADFALFYEESLVLEREWAARGGGVVLYSPTLPRLTQIQLRPEFANPRELLDVRVRRAIVHAIDPRQLVETLTGGKGLVTPSITSPLADYHPLVERVVVRYPYDPRRAQQLLEQAGFVKSGDSSYETPSGVAFRPELWHISGATNERENAIIAEDLRRGGIDVTSQTFPSAQLRDTERRAKLPGLFTGGGPGGEASLVEYSSSSIPRPENRWQGNNRGGWLSAEFDRFWSAYQTSLDRAERVEHLVQMERILSEDVGTIIHYYSPTINAHVRALGGPQAKTTPEAGVGMRGVHLWEWRS
jgi:peptide/nickel transport system substrate-binding protein